MSFWNKDLFRGEDDKRKKLAVRDWILMVIFAIFTWMLTALCAHLSGVSWIGAQFVSPLTTGVTIFLLIGTWMYPTLADIPIRRQWSSVLIFLLLGAFFFGFELRIGERNIYQVMLHGLPANGHWHRAGLAIGELGFVASYAGVLTIIRYVLWRKLDMRRRATSKRSPNGA